MRILLLVDQDLAQELKPALIQDECLVDWTDNAEKADYRAQTEEYDAAMVDRELLGDHSLSTFLRWRRAGLRGHLMALLSKDSSTLERTSVLDAGADTYLVRPFTAAELRARVRALRRSQENHDPIRRVHDLEINCRQRQVTRNGRPISLTPREFDLLQFLAFHQGRVVTRAMIRQHLYDHLDLENASNVVDVYIRYLRNKIDKGFNLPLILTRWGEGYMLRGPDE